MRSKLFVPGSRPEFFPKALAGAADAISFDLEDAVKEERKAEARGLVGDALSSPEFAASAKIIIVRVNALSTQHFAADVAGVARARLDLLNVPKVESAEDIRVVADLLDRIEAERGITRRIGILANIESPRGLRCAAEIAQAHSRVAGLQLGFGDLFEPLGIDRTDALAVTQVRLAMRLAAAEAGIWCCDAAYAAVSDPAGFKADALAAKRLGYLGKSCIHPSQVALANEIFRPTDEEIAHALRVVAAARQAAEQNVGAFTVDGRMIDAPFLKRAEAVAAIARQLGLGPAS